MNMAETVRVAGLSHVAVFKTIIMKDMEDDNSK